MKRKKLILSLIMFFSCFNQVHGMKSSSSSSADKNNESTNSSSSDIKSNNSEENEKQNVTVSWDLNAKSFVPKCLHDNESCGINPDSSSEPKKLNINKSRIYMPKSQRNKNSNANRDAIAKYVEDNPAKFSKIVNPEKYLRKGETPKDLKTKNAYYIKADKNLGDTLRGLLNAIIPDSKEYPDGKNKKEVLDKYTCKLRGWCLDSINPLSEETFKGLKKEYLKFIGKNYKNKFGIEVNIKPGDALQEHIQGFRYLPASNKSFKMRQNIRGICNQSILLNPKTGKYEINVPTDPKYKNNNILIESRAI